MLGWPELSLLRWFQSPNEQGGGGLSSRALGRLDCVTVQAAPDLEPHQAGLAPSSPQVHHPQALPATADAAVEGGPPAAGGEVHGGAPLHFGLGSLGWTREMQGCRMGRQGEEKGVWLLAWLEPVATKHAPLPLVRKGSVPRGNTFSRPGLSRCQQIAFTSWGGRDPRPPQLIVSHQQCMNCTAGGASSVRGRRTERRVGACSSAPSASCISVQSGIKSLLRVFGGGCDVWCLC